MKTNPGGQISPSEVIGRDELIRRLWRVLDRQSLVLSAERRMGKTCIVKKMVEEAEQDKVLPIYHDLEGIRTPLEFVEVIFQDVEAYLGRLQRTAGRVRQSLAHLTGLEVGGFIKFPDAVAPHWKTLLTKTIEDLVEHQDRIVIFFWDEMPLMLSKTTRWRGRGNGGVRHAPIASPNACRLTNGLYGLGRSSQRHLFAQAIWLCQRSHKRHGCSRCPCTFS